VPTPVQQGPGLPEGHYPYGEVWYSTGTTTKYLFTNYERDPESGNDYAMYRYHASRLGRFLSPDPVDGSPSNPQSLNRYAYTLNDPVNRIDPDGRCTIEIVVINGHWDVIEYCGPRIAWPYLPFRPEGGGRVARESVWERCRREVFVPCMDIAESRNRHCNLFAAAACAAAIGLCASLCDFFPPGCANCLSRALAFCTGLYFRCSEAFDRDTRSCFDKLNQCVQRGGP
jgi:RHS repeat-associated protein